MLDLKICGGRIVDGSGEDSFIGDVGVRDGRIVAVGRVDEPARRELAADGQLVTPGWVDVHTHYDGQVTWDTLLSPSCWHGVTTIVMGNCGVGFAPVRPGAHDYLIKLMEGVEDIPGTALAEGIDWSWESFPEYLDAIERKDHALDIGAQVPHAALRFYVMGERGSDHSEAPTPQEIQTMGELTRDAVRAGALGFTTSRTKNHRSSDGRYTPSLTATPEELIGISRLMGEAGQGVFELVSDFAGGDDEWKLFQQMVEVSGRPLSISLAQNDAAPDGWRRMLATVASANERGLPMKAQVPARAIGILLGLEATMNPFTSHPSYRAVSALPLAERVARLREPELRRKILAESSAPGLKFLVGQFDRIFVLGDPPDYEPPKEASLAAEAARRGLSAQELAYDLLLENDGHALLYRPFLNYSDFNLDATREMLLHPHTVPGLGDAGAHCGMICDGSFPTYLLSHWGRDRTRGERLPLEWLVKSQTSDTAQLVGLHDRGRIAPGLRADLNVIDFETVGMSPPEIIYDLPAGGRRLVQRASGYRATLQNGEVTFEDGESTGVLPGKLIRGAQTAA